MTTADMPPGGYVVINDIIHHAVSVKEPGQAPNTAYVPLFHCIVYNVWASSGPPALNFTVNIDKGSFWEARIPLAKMTTLEVEHALLNAQVKPVSDGLKYMKGFLMAWLTKLHEAAAAEASAPFGWHMDKGHCKGFSYGSILYKSDGTQGPAGAMDAVLKAMYEPQGDEQPWHDAFQVILDQKRPGFEVAVASSLASPMMFATGHSVGFFSMHGDTGSGKTTAMKVALAVWGNPKLAKENEGATQRSVLNRLGQIRNLPYMWDEIKDAEAQEKVLTLLYRSDGKDNSRLTSDIVQRAVGTWELIIGIAANKSFVDYVVGKNPDTAAGVVRVFEWKEMRAKKGAPGIRSSSDVTRLTRALEDNYGQIGKRWAAWLGCNRETVISHVTANTHWFEKAFEDVNRNNQDERFWVGFCAAIMSGAELSKQHLGLNFDTDAMRKFLVSKYAEQRLSAVEDQAEGGSFDWTQDLLTAFLKDYRRCTVRTETTVLGQSGRPGVVQIVPPLPEKGYPCHIQWAQGPGQLLLSFRELRKWVVKQGSEARAFKDALRTHFGATYTRASLAAGTIYKEENEAIVVIPVVPGSALWHAANSTDESATPVTPHDQNATGPGSDTQALFANSDAKNAA